MLALFKHVNFVFRKNKPIKNRSNTRVSHKSNSLNDIHNLLGCLKKSPRIFNGCPIESDEKHKGSPNNVSTRNGENEVIKVLESMENIRVKGIVKKGSVHTEKTIENNGVVGGHSGD